MGVLQPKQVVCSDIRPLTGRTAACLYSLFAVSTPAGRRFYFISAYRRSGHQEELEVSPVVSADPAEALSIFERRIVAGRVAPVHLVDVVQDLRQSRAGLPAVGETAQVMS